MNTGSCSRKFLSGIWKYIRCDITPYRSLLNTHIWLREAGRPQNGELSYVLSRMHTASEREKLSGGLEMEVFLNSAHQISLEEEDGIRGWGQVRNPKNGRC